MPGLEEEDFGERKDWQEEGDIYAGRRKTEQEMRVDRRRDKML